MTPDALQHYLKKLSILNRASKNGVKAPHKPILLLAVIEGIFCREMTNDWICITPQLMASFKDYWKRLVPQVYFKPNFALPLYEAKISRSPFVGPETATY